MIVKIEGKVDSDMLDVFITSLNDLEVLNRNRELEGLDLCNLDIYFSSSGGYLTYSTAIVELIKSRSNYSNNIKLIAFNELLSAGLDIFILADCKKEVLDSVVAMTHKSKFTVSLCERGKPYYYEDKFIIDTQLKGEVVNSCKINSILKLTDKEIKDFNIGKEIWFSSGRLKLLIK